VAAVISPVMTFSTASASGISTTETNSVGSGRGPARPRKALHRKRWQTSVARPGLVCTEARCETLSARYPVSSRSSL